MTRHDVKDPEPGLGNGKSRDREQIRARSVDRNIPIQDELSTGEANGLSIERGIELNRVSVVRVEEGLAERAGTAIVSIGDGEGGGERPRVEVAG